MSMLRRVRRYPVLAGLLCTAALAQDTDAEGRRWYQVEVVVFAHENPAAQVTERPLADPTVLGWLPRLRELQSALTSLVFDFEPALPMAVTLEQPAMFPGTALQQPPTQLLPAAEPIYGPVPAPTVTRGFRLADSSRDPYIALDQRNALLAQDISRLESSSEHRVLWHGTWLQPMVPTNQSAAVAVLGGDQYGDRHEVEGSLRFSDSGGRVQLDAHLWFSSFLAGFASEGTAWTLPELPAMLLPEKSGEDTVAEAVADIERGTWMSSGAWQLRDSRLLTAESYHYLDNPAIGVIVQIRPYSLPPRDVPGTDEDF
jgi:hypothetical protein